MRVRAHTHKHARTHTHTHTTTHRAPAIHPHTQSNTQNLKNSAGVAGAGRRQHLITVKLIALLLSLLSSHTTIEKKKSQKVLGGLPTNIDLFRIRPTPPRCCIQATCQCQCTSSQHASVSAHTHTHTHTQIHSTHSRNIAV